MGIKADFRPSQIEARDRAIAALEGGGGFGLWPDPRVGKTLTALAVVDHFKPHWLVVVCPKAALAEWDAQIPQYLEIEKSWNLQITLINFEQLVIHRKQWYKWAKAFGSQMLIVCDESHWIKNRGKNRSRVVRKIAKSAKYRLALTGTPIGQGRKDAWAQFDFINPEIFGTWDEFDDKYLIWGGYKKHQVVGYKNTEDFEERFHANSFRVTLREAREKPLKIQYTQRFLELSGLSRRVYDSMERELIAVVNEKKVKAKNVLSCITKLQQITGGWVLDSESSPNPIGSEKLEDLHTVVRSLTARSKFIVVARYVHELESIRASLKKLGYSVEMVRGGMPYSGSFTADAIVMQIQSGISRDMAAADTMIFYSIDYSFFNLHQSKFRILSYDKPFGRYVFLIAKGTIDEVVYASVVNKTNLAKAVVDRYRTRKRTRTGGQTSVRN